MSNNQSKNSFTGSIGFVLAAAGSAVGLGNIWRFPYLAAKGGGVFLLCYLIAIFTFGFALLTTEIAIGRKTGCSPLTAYGVIHKKFKWLGGIASIIPAIILPYYCVIGGWVVHYMVTFVTLNGEEAANSEYFGSFVNSIGMPIICFVVFLAVTMFVIYKGVTNGIEKMSKFMMPVLLVLILIIAIYSLTISSTDADGTVRTGIDGMKKYVIPNFEGMTFDKFLSIMMDAVGQLFYSVSVAMGIMVAYGSYAKKETNLVKSVNQIEFFDTMVAFLAGLMVVPAVYVFQGTEEMQAGPNLLFVSLPKIFNEMGKIGIVIGIVFFVMVLFAALTSSVSLAEAIVSCIIDRFKVSRNKAIIYTTIIALVLGLSVCLGYNVWYFELTFPNGSVGQILDIFDFIANYLLMPILAIVTCIFIGWVVKPKVVIDELTVNGEVFKRKKLYILMIKFVVPILLVLLVLKSFSIL